MTFVSLNGTNCRVDIYKRGYEGNEVVELVGAANPFEYEEDDSEDTLNSVIRYRTGYLRIIEDNYGDLDELYPLLNTDRYIEFYYGENLDFNGFIQAQEFENPWAPGPREVELPVISPLGLAAHTTIDWTQYNPPRWMLVDDMIKAMLDALDGGYFGYCFPKILTIERPVCKCLYLNSLTFCPFGNNYDKTSSDLTGIYDPKTVGDALTNICTWLGLILHDAPEWVVFQRLDFFGPFQRTLYDYTPSITDLTQTAEIVTNNNVFSRVLPMSKISVAYAGARDVPNMDFSRCRGNARGCAIEDYEYCTNSPMISDFIGDYDIYTSINQDGLVDKGVISLGAYGNGGLQEMIIFRPASNWGTAKKVATYVFYEWNGLSTVLHFKYKYGDSIEDLDNPNSQPIAVIIKCGNKYWNDQQQSWDSLDNIGSRYSSNWADGRDYCEVGMTVNHDLKDEVLVVEFYAPDNSENYIYTISDVGLAKGSSASDQYLNKNFYNIDYEIQGSPSLADGSVERGYSTTPRNNTLNKLREDERYIIGTSRYEIIDAEPSYPYLLSAQDRLNVSVKMPRLDSTAIYLNKFITWGSNGYWRILACGFKPWDDTYKLTLHHSTTFDT